MWKTCISVGAVGAITGIAAVGWTPLASAATGVVMVKLAAPVVGLAANPTGGGYWEVTGAGGIFPFGNATFYGSMGGRHLHAPIVGMAAAPTGHGYWEVASDGGIFAFGSAGFYGSMGGKHLNAPVVGMAAAPTGHGYWEVAADGGIFTFGTAAFDGSMGGKPTGAPIIGMAADSASAGYWEAGAAGEVFTMGTARFDGAIVDTAPLVPRALIVATANSQVGETDGLAYGPSAGTWCAYFTSWVWRHAGIPIPAIGPAADIGTWALAHGGSMVAPGATPAPGDAVLWVRADTPHVWPDAAALNFPNILHANIVTQVLANGEIVTVGGNESGAVRRLGPFSVGGASSYFGQAIYGFVRPPA